MGKIFLSSHVNYLWIQSADFDCICYWLSGLWHQPFVMTLHFNACVTPQHNSYILTFVVRETYWVLRALHWYTTVTNTSEKFWQNPEITANTNLDVSSENVKEMYLVRYRKLKNFQTWCGPPNLLHNGHQCSLLKVKWAGCEVNYSPPSSARVQELYLCFPYMSSWCGQVKIYLCLNSTVRTVLLHAAICSCCCVRDRKNMLCWTKEHDKV